MNDKTIDDFLSDIDPKPQIIKTLMEEFIYEASWAQGDMNIPIPHDYYRKYLLESKESFLSFLLKEHVGFLEDLRIMHLWDYRAFLDEKLNPKERTIYIIVVRKFIKFCHQNGCLDNDISSDLHLVKDNRSYISDMDPLSIDILDIL
jgi:hypothetical protein